MPADTGLPARLRDTACARCGGRAWRLERVARHPTGEVVWHALCGTPTPQEGDPRRRCLHPIRWSEGP